MARSTHAHYTAADRFERSAARRQRFTVRRTGTRSALVALAIREN